MAEVVLRKNTIDAEIEAQEKRLEEENKKLEDLKKKKEENSIQAVDEYIDEWIAVSDKMIELLAPIVEKKEEIEPALAQLREKLCEGNKRCLVIEGMLVDLGGQISESTAEMFISGLGSQLVGSMKVMEVARRVLYGSKFRIF